MTPYSIRRILWASPAATAAAILANSLYYIVTKTLGAQYLLPLDENGVRLGPLSVLVVIEVTLAAGLTATILFGALIRFARQPVIVFLSVAVTALLLSFGGPFGLPGAALQTKLLLSGMHLLAATIITGGILLLSRKKAKVP